MAEVMLGNELHPDRVIPVEKLYEILNEYGIPYSFTAQHGIENSAFAVTRCKNCKHWRCIDRHGGSRGEGWGVCDKKASFTTHPSSFCSSGERKM